MRLDQFSNPIFNEKDLFEALYKGQSFSSDMIVDSSFEIRSLETQLGFFFLRPYSEDVAISLVDYDKACQDSWFMPKDYCPNLVEMLYGMCTTPEQTNRVSEELEAFVKHGMYDLLHYLKYMVDTLEENHILWGVGRGSSVASYVLYLIGVHSVDSIKYNLDWQEFLR
ncbi:Bacterial DNA polymerase III, alpha subunit [uncultured Caudovirales phage]|uniref:Bacterial DNA polymerase III, alpha subunit n=1 Tax=uncultured Caudovirales phage TaxID=2100421 RepID=A0A6J7WE54_9CAUD|nr:Bacterial DNA polymerase III, alpha subunit [uncultured Caudovirales phage]CAB5208923.1 Bacterial DNA polymerase III, alpha subunit [uncultured Caudovirales phage]